MVNSGSDKLYKMTTAIVTITCPSCGGRIDDVPSTDEEQTIKCRFCGTDLHIPRVGAVLHEVVHEVIREVPSAPVYETDQLVSLRPRTHRNGLMIAIALGMAALLPIMIVVTNNSADEDIQKIYNCTANCKSSCEHAGDKEPPDQGELAIQATLQSSDRAICELHCKQDKCSSSDR